jgi:hypothetical protein
MIYTACGENYNCTKGENKPSYFMPVFATDKFMLQTVFLDEHNADEAAPVNGWGNAGAAFVSAELWDTTGVVSTDVTAFTSRRMVGWSGTQSYQIVEVDVALVAGLITGSCFSITLNSHAATGTTVVDSVCTQDFVIEDNCNSTILIGSTMSKSDCCLNWYGDPVAFVGDNFTYDNTMRYRGSVQYTGGGVEKTVEKFNSNIKAKKTSITENYEISFRDKMPEFLAKLLHRVHLAGESVQIDGVTYYLDSLEIESALRCSFNFPVVVYQYCENKFKC